MDISSYDIEGKLVFRIRGSLDQSNSGDLGIQIDEQAIRKGRREVIVDMKDVTFVDSMAIGLLIKMYSRVKDSGGRLLLANQPQMLMHALRQSGVGLRFPNFTSIEGAIDSLADDSSRTP